MTNNLYILNEVLCDYTAGMAVIAAPSLERARELFLEEFAWFDNGSIDFKNYHNENLVKEFDSAGVKVIEGVNHPEGVVSYVYGGG